MGHPVLDTMLRNQAAALAVCQTETSIEYESDPQRAGRTIIRISAPTRAGVQLQIDKVMAVIDRDGGFANFVGPYRDGVGYRAKGEAITYAEAAE